MSRILFIHGLGTSSDSIDLENKLFEANLLYYINSDHKIKSVNYAQLRRPTISSSSLFKVLPQQVLSLGCAYLANNDFRFECLIEVRNSICYLADSKISDDPSDNPFVIIAYSFGTIIAADLLTLLEDPDLLESTFNYTKSGMKLLKCLKLVVSFGCPFAWFLPERPIPIKINPKIWV